MNLNPLNSETGKILNYYARKYQLPFSTGNGTFVLSKTIVLCEGTPDNLVMAIAAHQINGSDIAGIIKPEGKTNTASFDDMPLLIRGNKSLRGLLFILDQEENSLTSITRKFTKQLNKTGAVCQSVINESNQHCQIFNTIYGSRKVDIFLVTNGHPEIISRKHTIEDHLIKAASRLNLLDLSTEIDDPKKYWYSRIDPAARDKVIKALIEDKLLLGECFPQHIKGLQSLKSLG